MSTTLRVGDKAFAIIETDVWNGLDFLRLTGFEHSYVVGFKEGADSLIRAVLQDGCATFDSRIIPACHLYRHYIELRLKYILSAGRAVKHIAFDDSDIQSHGVYRLWNLTKKLLLVADPTESKELLGATEAIVQEFHHMDPSGQESRYHKTTAGGTSLTKLPPLFDLRNLMDTMNKVETYLREVAFIFDCQFDDPDFRPESPPMKLFPPKECRPTLVRRFFRYILSLNRASSTL